MSTLLNIPIIVFIGIEEKTTLEEAKAWQMEATCKVDVKEFPGNHFFIFDYEKEIIQNILTKLNKLISIV